MSYLGGPLPGFERTEEEEQASIDRAVKLVKDVGQALVPDLRKPEEVAQHFTELGSDIWRSKNLYKGVGMFVGKKVISQSPEIRKAVSLAKEFVDPVVQKTKKFLDTNHFEPIYESIGVRPRSRVTPGVENNTFFASSTPLPSTGRVSRTAGGYMGRGTSGLSSSYINPKSQFAELFRKLKGKQIQGAGKHHHVLDEAFMGKALNTSDFKEVLEELNKIKIYPGDSPKNIIMMMDEGNLFLQSGKADFAKQLAKKGYKEFEGIENYGHLMRKGYEKQKKLIDDLFKNPDTKLDKTLAKGSRDKLTKEITQPELAKIEQPFPSGSSVNWKESLGLNVDSEAFKKLSRVEQTAAKRKAWANRFNRLGIDRKSIKFDPDKMILAKDHIDKIHYSVYNSPKFKQRIDVLNSIKDGSWYNLTAKQKASKIAEVYKVQRNASINAAKLRLKTIKNYIKENVAPKQAELLLRDPELLRKWVVNNPKIAANLSWKEAIPDFKTLIDPKSAETVTDELRTVFSTLIE
jgi:hypothetical protein